MRIKTDVVIVGTGVAGMFSALKLPRDKKIVIITKEDMRSSDAFLAQGGICVLRDENDYDSYFEDTMKAGHYENRKESVDIMIRGSRDIINDLVGYGVDFKMDGDDFAYTREGAHSRPRILYHEDITGKEISEKLLQQVLKLENVTILEYTTMQDIFVENGKCTGLKAVSAEAEEDMRIPPTIRISQGMPLILQKNTMCVWNIWIMCRSIRQRCIPRDRAADS